MKKKILLILLLVLIPLNVLAYSNFIIPGGQNIGIRLNKKYVTVIGFYKVNNEYIGENSGFRLGDNIYSINDEIVNTIDEMISFVDKYKDNGKVEVLVIRNNKKHKLTLPIELDKDNIYKTGLYVKDEINGIGTLTYIDPGTNVFGALGHEISEKLTKGIVEMAKGIITDSKVTNIVPSRDGEPGEKKAIIDFNNELGEIKENSVSGIYGEYLKYFNKDNLIEVGTSDDVKIGKATIRTVLDDYDIDEYEINIIGIDKENETKNILFEITDPVLLKKTGGVVAGMSGSPIIQNNKIIGAVTHVIVSDSKKGYGIFITTMLEEGDSN